MSIYVSIVEPGRRPTIERTRALIIPLVRSSSDDAAPLKIDSNYETEPLVTVLASDDGWSILDRHGEGSNTYPYGCAAEVGDPTHGSIALFQEADEFRGNQPINELLDDPVATLGVRLRTLSKSFELRPGDEVEVGGEELPLPMKPSEIVFELSVDPRGVILVRPVTTVGLGDSELAGAVSILPSSEPTQLHGEGWLVTLDVPNSRLLRYGNSGINPTRGDHQIAATAKASEG
jgi:hypothetical protein